MEKCLAGWALALATVTVASFAVEEKSVSPPKTASKRPTAMPRTLVKVAQPHGSMSPQCGRQHQRLRLPPWVCLIVPRGRRLGRLRLSGRSLKKSAMNAPHRPSWALAMSGMRLRGLAAESSASWCAWSESVPASPNGTMKRASVVVCSNQKSKAVPGVGAAGAGG